MAMIHPTQLLKRLEPPVRPVSADDTGDPIPLPTELQSFDQLMTLVARGDITSNRPVTVDAHIDPPLEEAQKTRLAVAADVAQHNGSKHAVLMLDGRALILDVAQRLIHDELSGRTPGGHSSVDAAVYVADEDEEIYGVSPPKNADFLPSGMLAHLESARHSLHINRRDPGINSIETGNHKPA